MKCYDNDMSTITGIISEIEHDGKTIVTYALKDGDSYTAVVEDYKEIQKIDVLTKLNSELLRSVENVSSGQNATEIFTQCNNLFDKMKDAYKMNEFYRYLFYTTTDDMTKAFSYAIVRSLNDKDQLLSCIVATIKLPGNYKPTSNNYVDCSIQEFVNQNTISHLLNGEIDITSDGMIVAIYGDDMFYKCHQCTNSNVRRRQMNS